MKRRNPQASPHRPTKANELKTVERIAQYHGVLSLLQTWETQPDAVQIREHDYIYALRRRVRQIKMYIEHRADPAAELSS